MNCNVIIAGLFSSCNLNAYRLRLAVWCLVMALHLIDLWISGQACIGAVGPVQAFLLLAGVPGMLYNVVLAGVLLVGVIYCPIGFRALISPLHSNSGYDMPVRAARILIGLFAPYWFIIPAIAVQRAYKCLKTNKILFSDAYKRVNCFGRNDAFVRNWVVAGNIPMGTANQ
jgi:hypothetical protein